MKAENLEKLIVGVDIQEDYLYQEIVLLVDKLEFLKKLEEIRERLKIDKPLGKAVSWELTYQKWIAEKPERGKIIENAISEIIKIYGCPYYFRDILKQAIVFGLVRKGWGCIKIFTPKDTIHTPFIAILPSIKTTDTEALKALKIAKVLYKKLPRFQNFKKPLDTFPFLWRYRGWYWERTLFHKTYNQIADEWIKNPKCPENDNTTYLEVLKGVRLYKKLLQG